MSTVKLIIVATINHNESEALSYYLEKVGELYQEVAAESLGKFKVTKSLIGDYTPSLVSIMEFKDADTLQNVFEGEEYQKLLSYREKAFVKVEAYISE